VAKASRADWHNRWCFRGKKYRLVTKQRKKFLNLDIRLAFKVTMKKLDKLNSPITDDSVKEDFDREKIDQVRSGSVTISIMTISIMAVSITTIGVDIRHNDHQIK
jgi:hypothetical protein